MDLYGGRLRMSLRHSQCDAQKNQPHGNATHGKKDDVRLSRADVKAAFSFFDVDGKKELKPRDLKVRLSAFYPEMTNKEFKFLLGESGGRNFTEEALWSIIDGYHRMQLTDSITENLNIEPMREAFRIYDPKNRGVVDVDVLSGIMKRIGLGDISREEIDLLIKAADFDKDGKINFDDFQNLLQIGR